MTPICFLAMLFALLCVLAAFFAGVVWRDGQGMAPTADRETAGHD